MTWVVFGVVLVLVVVLGLLVAAGNKLLRSSRRGVSSGLGDGLGSFIDVFDPGNARAARDLKEQDNIGQVVPSPDGDQPHEVDLHTGRITIRRPAN